MIGIFVDHDVVSAPVPIAAVAKIIWSHREIESAEPESTGTTALNAENMAAAKSAVEMPMFPGAINVIVIVVATGIVAYPLVSAGVDVRSLRVALLVTVASRWLLCGARLLL
jgi:hypothetical protein